MLAKRKVKVVQNATFKDANTLEVVNGDDVTTIKFEKAIIAAGSQPIKLPFIPEDRVFFLDWRTKTSRYEGHLLIIGGGIIGCEMATIYRALGAKVQ